MKLKKLALALLLTSAIGTASVYAQTVDLSIGASGWVTGGDTGGTQTGPYGSTGVGSATATGAQTVSCCGPNTWVISPYTGSTMFGMQPGSTMNYPAMQTGLGLSADSVTSLNSVIAGTGGSITSAAWVSKDFAFQANTTFKMAWVYTSTDYVPFNDGSITTLVNTGSATTLGKINGVSAQYLLLGATNPGTGNYSTDSYGSTGWQQVNYEITTAGTYKLGFAIFNQGDTALSPVLFVNDDLGTVTKNGTAFGAVAPNDPSMPSVVTPPVVVPPAVTVTGTATTDSVTSTTSSGVATITNAIAYGATAVAVAVDNVRGAVTPKTLTVNQTTVTTMTTPFTVTHTTTTPVTTTTTTTPVTVTTYSDGSTTTANGTPVVTTTTTDSVTATDVNGVEIAEADVRKDYSTRVDQYDYLNKANQRFNQQLDSNPLDRHTAVDGVFTSKTSNDDRTSWAYVIADGQKSNTNSDGYSMTATRFGVGYEKQIESNHIVGAQVNNINSTLSGSQAGGSLVKNAVGIYSLYAKDDWLLKSDLGVAVNDYTNYHALPELAMSNTGKTSGMDVWINNRVYAPAYEGFRPYAGVRVENNQVKGLTEAGTALTSMTYNKTNTTNTTGEVGVRFGRKVFDTVNLIAEAGRNTNDLSTFKLGASYSPEKNVLGVINIGQQRQNGVTNNIAQVNVKLMF